MCFNGTKIVVRLIVGIPSAVVMLAMLYCVRIMRENDEERSKGAFLIRTYGKLYSFFDRFYPWLRKDSDSTELRPMGSQTPPVPQLSNV